MGINEIFIPYKIVEKPKTTNITMPEINIPIQQSSIASQVQNILERSKATNGFQGWSNSGDKKSSDISTSSEPLNTRNETTAKDFIKQQEGFRNSRYKDAGGTSIGYGFYGTKHWKGNSITKDQADKVLDNILAELELTLAKYPVWNKLNENLKAALHSYMYNVGSGKFAKGTKMGDALASGNLLKIHDAISITTSQGNRNEALVRRRNQEKQLFKS